MARQIKYNVLEDLRRHLESNYCKNTAKKYYGAVCGIVKDINFSSAGDIDPEVLKKNLSALKTRQDFSAAKQGLIQWKKISPDLNLPDKNFFDVTSKGKKNTRKRKFEKVKLSTLKRRINVNRDDRLKTAYRLMLVSGLRVSEVASLEPGDIEIKDDRFYINVRKGKGGQNRRFESLADSYTKNKLESILDTKTPGEKLFPCADTLMKEANAKNFECHDLRRAFAKVYYQEQKLNGSTHEETQKNLMAAMGHKDWKTTQRYLKREIDIKG